MLPEYRRVILDKLKTTGKMPDIESRIVFESALTPQDIHDRYRVLNGAIYGLASHGKWTGAFKPANRSRDIEGLYLAGGAAHPGPGHADGADVRLDRRRCARSGCHRAAPKDSETQTQTGAQPMPTPCVAAPPRDRVQRHVELPRRWFWLVSLFRRYATRYVRSHFHAVRLSAVRRRHSADCERSAPGRAQPPFVVGPDDCHRADIMDAGSRSLRRD